MDKEHPLDSLVVRLAEAHEFYVLRHRVLRAELPPEAAMFSADLLPTSKHIGGFLGETVVCCASFFLNDWDGEPAWQLRGMATMEKFRGKGIGRSVLVFAEELLREADEADVMWCNARLPAVPFYEALGWQVKSEQFEIPTAGPHHRMMKRLDEMTRGDHED